jgi:spore coat polysaccharide biosynthesis predicted glycosyltransferase SpsG
MNIKIITAVNSKIGFGHLRRMKTLGLALFKRGHKVDVELIDSENINLKTFFDFELEKFSQIDCVLFDHHQGLDELIKGFKDKKIKTVALDYFSYKEHADLTINIFEHFKPIPEGKRKQGFQYVMLREDIVPLKSIVKDEGYVLVMLGGADINNSSLGIAKKLAQRGYKVKLIYGPLVAKKDIYIDQVEIYYGPNNLLNLMAGCSYAVCNAGSTLFELTYLKKSVWVSPQSEFEFRIASHFLNNKWILGLGDNPQLESQIDFSVLEKLPINEHGTENIINEIEGLYE